MIKMTKALIWIPVIVPRGPVVLATVQRPDKETIPPERVCSRSCEALTHPASCLV